MKINGLIIDNIRAWTVFEVSHLALIALREMFQMSAT